MNSSMGNITKKAQRMITKPIVSIFNYLNRISYFLYINLRLVLRYGCLKIPTLNMKLR